MAGVLEPEWAKALTLAVALSMAGKPVFFMLLTRNEKTGKGEAGRGGEIDEGPPRGIGAGVGPFGQTAGRLVLLRGGKLGGSKVGGGAGVAGAAGAGPVKCLPPSFGGV
ncbi:hypothetical protein CH642_27665 [Salmonella enterica subsp. enterica serovar Heidelberg]|nr:hypothetical protein CH642_27665 [Salmonella enterica subsp. enterica serovar Heidelberg]